MANKGILDVWKRNWHKRLSGRKKTIQGKPQIGDTIE